MTIILDTGGISALAGHRARLAELRKRNLWPPLVPAAVLTEALTGDHRRDFHTNRLLSMCLVTNIDEQLAREAAYLRTSTSRAGEITATNALVAATAARADDPNILTSDPNDLSALAAHASMPITITPV